MPQIRKFARIDAAYNLTDADEGKEFEHVVGRAGNWIKPAPAWEVPYEALLPKGVDGLLAAGRCIGAEGYAWEILRVIPAAAMTGEAAGIAAALCARKNLSPAELPYAELKANFHSLPDKFDISHFPTDPGYLQNKQEF